MSYNMEKLWDDTVGGPVPESGLYGEAGSQGMLQKRSGGEFDKSRRGIAIARPLTKNLPRSLSMEGSPPASPSGSSPSTTPRDKDNVWRSVFHPGSNVATKKIGAQKFDNAEPRSPTVYDWLYSGETKSKWR